MTNSSIYAAFERMWQHVVTALGKKADKADIVQSDWTQNDETALDYVKNRTHYEGVITSDTLTWDGNIEGKIGVNDMFYLVSEAALTFEDFANGAIVTYIYSNGNIIQREWTSDRIDVRDNGSFELANQQVIVIPESAAGTNGPYSDTFFEKAGIYFLNYEGIYTSALTINGYSFETPYIKKLDLKFLPDNIGGDGSDIYVQETEPENPEVGDIWVDTSVGAAIEAQPLSILQGGTGATTIEQARENLGIAPAFSSGETILSSYQYGDTLPEEATEGRIFFKKAEV